MDGGFGESFSEDDPISEFQTESHVDKRMKHARHESSEHSGSLLITFSTRVGCGVEKVSLEGFHSADSIDLGVEEGEVGGVVAAGCGRAGGWRGDGGERRQGG